MDGSYGEVRCPNKRPHFKNRNGKQIKEEFCTKLIGMIDADEKADVMMYCSSCKSFISVSSDGTKVELSVIKNKIPTKPMMGIVNEYV